MIILAESGKPRGGVGVEEQLEYVKEQNAFWLLLDIIRRSGIIREQVVEGEKFGFPEGEPGRFK